MSATDNTRPRLQAVWSPADYHETWERAAIVQAIRAVADEFPREVRESQMLADLVDRELR